MFFVFVFPVLMLLVLGYLFGGQSGNPVLYYADRDGSQASRELVAALNATGALDLRDGSSLDQAQSLEDGSIHAYIEISAGFGDSIAAASTSGNGSGVGLTLRYDRSRSDAAALVSAVTQAVDQFNVAASASRELVTVSRQDVATGSGSYVDYLFPGILGICIMFAAVNETVGVVSRYQATGTMRKIVTTPLASMEWNASRLISGTITVLLSVAISLAAAWLAFGCAPEISVLSVLMLIAGAVTFTGLGLALTQVFEGMQSANATIYLATLPLILVSGSLFPVEELPCMLKFLSILSPLTYLTSGLRDAMFGGDRASAIVNLLIVVFLGVMLLVIGTAIMMGKEGHEI